MILGWECLREQVANRSNLAALRKEDSLEEGSLVEAYCCILAQDRTIVGSLVALGCLVDNRSLEGNLDCLEDNLGLAEASSCLDLAVLPYSLLDKVLGDTGGNLGSGDLLGHCKVHLLEDHTLDLAGYNLVGTLGHPEIWHSAG